MPQALSSRVSDPSTGRQRRADLQCSECDRCFSKPEHLRRHVRVHNGTKPFVCTYDGCGRQFNRPDSLARHGRTHHDVRSNSIPGGNDMTPVFSPQSLGAAMYNDHSLHTPNSDDNINVGGSMQTQDFQFTPVDSNELPYLDSLMNVDHFTYSWPESEQIFNFLTTELEPSILMPQAHANSFSTQHDEQSEQVSARSQHALNSMTSLVQDFSTSLAREVQTTGITPELLDICLGCFFSQFLPVFPMIHEPTFSLKDCSPPLLLNIIAIGSLSISGEGQTIAAAATSMGEALWKMAHAAVVTSWQSLLNQGRDTHGRPASSQLVLSTLLSQAYALLSGNSSLRKSSHAFRSIGLSWATSFYADSATPPLDANTLDNLSLQEQWKNWANKETRQRALIGHYMLDGLMSQSSGLPSSARHTINNMKLPSSHDIFSAPNAESWHRATLREDVQADTTFRELLLELFEFDRMLDKDISWTHMSLPVIMEALQSLVSDMREAGGPSVGLPTRNDLSRALYRFYDWQINSPVRPAATMIDLSTRWHIVCISLLAEPRGLVHAMYKKHGIAQGLYGGEHAPSVRAFDLDEWARSPLARRALLHALSVLERTQRLAFSDLKAPHLPFAVYIAIMVLLALTSTVEANRINVPETVDWQVVCDLNHTVTTNTLDNSTQTFIESTIQPATTATCVRNLLVDINTLQALLKSFPWGIAREMRKDLEQLMAARQQYNRVFSNSA